MKSSCGQPEGHQAVWTAWQGNYWLASHQKADVNVKIWRRGRYVRPAPLTPLQLALASVWSVVRFHAQIAIRLVHLRVAAVSPE